MTKIDISANRQEAPFPGFLSVLLEQLRYKKREGWMYWLEDMDRGQGSKGLTLVIHRVGPDSYHLDNTIAVNHYFPVPPASYDQRSWRRWLFERLHDVELHELMENFQLVTHDGNDMCDNENCPARHVERPYAPSHGPGNDPYLVREVGTELDQRTLFTGQVKPYPDIGASEDSSLT